MDTPKLNVERILRQPLTEFVNKVRDSPDQTREILLAKLCAALSENTTQYYLTEYWMKLGYMTLSVYLHMQFPLPAEFDADKNWQDLIGNMMIFFQTDSIAELVRITGFDEDYISYRFNQLVSEA